MKELFWSLPMLFIFHDLEEIIFTKYWINNLDREKMYKRFPEKIIARLFTHFDNITTGGFALAVAEIYILLVICTCLSYFFNFYILWLCLFLVFTIHLFVHCCQAIVFRGYVPSLVTSIICIPICCIILKVVMPQINYSVIQVIMITVLSAVIALINVLVLHRLMEGWGKRL